MELVTFMYSNLVKSECLKVKKSKKRIRKNLKRKGQTKEPFVKSRPFERLWKLKLMALLEVFIIEFVYFSEKCEEKKEE